MPVIMVTKGDGPLKISVLSGKGGTGKTLVSVNLAAACRNAVYLDCDVEEPNGHLFFKPTNLTKTPVTVKIPLVDMDLCNGCRICIDFCKFHALAFVGSKLLVFEEICHSCGGCTLLCPQKALSESDHPIGVIQSGFSESVKVVTGFLNPGESTGIPIIKEIFAQLHTNSDPVLIDCPPGSACTVMESIQDADYCVLVAEPTLFGLHNLKMVHELVVLFNKPHGVVLNKCMPGNNPSEDYCREQGIKVLLEIPFDEEIGRLNSDGRILVREKSEYQTLFEELLKQISQEVAHETAVDLKW